MTEEMSPEEQDPVEDLLKIMSTDLGVPVEDLRTMTWRDLEPVANRVRGRAGTAMWDMARELLAVRAMADFTRPLPAEMMVEEGLGLGLLSHSDVERAMNPTDEEIEAEVARFPGSRPCLIPSTISPTPIYCRFTNARRLRASARGRLPFRTDPGTIPDVDRNASETLVPLAEAAQRLGIAYDTARKRLRAGLLRGERRGDRWYVWIAPTPDDSGPIPDENQTVPDARDRLIDALESEVGFLRQELQTRTDELERRDVLLREALVQVPQLPAGVYNEEPASAQDARIESTAATGSTETPARQPETFAGDPGLGGWRRRGAGCGGAEEGDRGPDRRPGAALHGPADGRPPGAPRADGPAPDRGRRVPGGKGRPTAPGRCPGR